MDPNENPEIIEMVGGLAPIFRWTGDESIIRKKYGCCNHSCIQLFYERS